MAGGGAVRVDSRSGLPGWPPGRFELTVQAGGRARLDHRDGAGARTWTGLVDPAVWRRLLDALDQSGYADVRPGPIPPDSTLRELTVEPGGALQVGWHEPVEPALGEVFRILDALVHQVGGGEVRSTADALPPVVHERTAEGRRTLPAAGAAAFGTAGGTPAYVVADEEV